MSKLLSQLPPQNKNKEKYHQTKQNKKLNEKKNKEKGGGSAVHTFNSVGKDKKEIKQH